jgi:hypothetical protein
MTVEQTVRHLMLKFPSLFKSRWDVYEHVLVLNGTGYIWENGQAICERDSGDPVLTTLQDGIDHFWSYYFNEKSIYSNSLNFLFKYAKENLDTLLKIEENIGIFEPSSRSHKYFTQWTLLFHQPEDIKEDWKVACDQMIAFYINERNLNLLEESDSKLLSDFLTKQNG